MIEHRYIEVPGGTIHCAIAGRGAPVLLLHQTPRSWDEYRDVLPLLAPRCQGGHDFLLAYRVERARKLVAEQNRGTRRLEQATRNGNALLLSA